MSSSKLPNFINKAKVQAEEIFDQTRTYFVEKYNQAGKVFSISSAYGQLLHALSQISSMILYYIEDSINELNIYSASRTTSIQGLARLSGHNVTRTISSTGEIQINLVKVPTGINGTQILIPRYSRIVCVNNNLSYVLDIQDQEIRLQSGDNTAVYAKVVQGQIESQIHTSDGNILQSYSVQDKNFNFIDNFFVKVYINGKEWKSFDSLYDIPMNYEGFISKTGISGGLDIYFGNTNFGKIPPSGAEIRIEYLRSTGSGGNLKESNDVYFKWIDSGYSLYGEEIDLNEITIVKMSKVISFGSNGETIEMTKLLAPKTSRSYVFANPTNYVNFLQKFNYFSVIDAYTTFDDQYIDDDNVIYLYLIPDITKRINSGDNYFTVPESYFTLSEQEKDKVYSLIEDSGSKIVTTVVKIVDPIIKKYVMNVSLITFEGYNTSTIRSQVISTVSDYFLSVKRRDRIPKSDLIKSIELLEGVDSVNISFISQLNEIKTDQTLPLIGLDEFGDIILEKDDLVLIRGGWSDHNNITYSDTISSETPCAINIDFKKTSKKL